MAETTVPLMDRNSFDHALCAACEIPEHKDYGIHSHDEYFISSLCHPGVALLLQYDKRDGLLHVLCGSCRARVMDVLVEKL